MRVLILDDSKTIRRILKRILSGIGFEAVEASNGLEGLERLKNMTPPELMTVDWDMPEMDGLSFVRAVRGLPQYDSSRLIMVTSNNHPAQIAQALEAGANEYIMKPFDEEVVQEKLELMGASCI
jgi:two-component system, chemotaxis family, chemotaxis protein CheY